MEHQLLSLLPLALPPLSLCLCGSAFQINNLYKQTNKKMHLRHVWRFAYEMKEGRCAAGIKGNKSLEISRASAQSGTIAYGERSPLSRGAKQIRPSVVPCKTLKAPTVCFAWSSPEPSAQQLPPQCPLWGQDIQSTRCVEAT